MINEALGLLPSPWSWVLYFTCALMVGMSKTGIQNIGTLAVPFFAFLFGAKQSTGIVLILICMADLMAVIYYRKQFLWEEIRKLLPAAALGVALALLLGAYINDKTFKVIMGICILLGLLLMFSTQFSKSDSTIVQRRWYAPVFGWIVGFSTMIGNAAGPALSIYLLSKKLDKVTFVATGAWFIMILNYAKIPLQVLVWKNISWPGIILNIYAIPFILLGGFLGIKLVKIIPERTYRICVTALIFIASVLLII